MDDEFNDPRIETAEANVLVLQHCLSVMANRAPDSHDRWITTGLLKAAHRAYIHLRHGWSGDTAYSAWGCRNLLELRIITKYVLQSPTKRRRFFDDVYADATAYTEATKTVSTQLVPEMNVDSHDSMMSILEARKVARQITKHKYLPVRDMADSIGLRDTYDAMNKVCSKMVHPTSLSILTVDIEDQAQANRNMLLLAGCVYLTEIVTNISTFAESLIRR
jgi:hypothetical protein